ncbi:hypothetical protein [Planctomyces sp. SH-PL62]|uniref:hypothetical protein n=1 Tax=Planctomyces sp. SH-PL62 TaxID=1636152 RepID=UPI00078E7A64|nr:hypothetical protein [Planctomyces sp. SH-PL62]AMV40994.1 hypothetical protein VT85_26400 [Planctomyces sp. SH-PL62]
MSTLHEPTTSERLDEARSRLKADLARLRRRLRLQLALEVLAEALAVAIATGAALIALDWALRPGLPARMVLLAMAVAAVLTFVVVRSTRRWRTAGLDELSLALTLDRHRPGLGQQVADVLQLPGLLDDPHAAASPAMVRLAVRRASEALDASDWTQLWNRGRTASHAALGVVALIVPAAFAAIAPDAARLSVARWLRGSDERWPQSTYLTVMGLDARGRLIAPRDERALVEVRGDLPLIEPRGDRWSVGGRGEPLLLRRKPEAPRNPDSVTVREYVPKASARSATMTETAPGRYQYEFPPSSDSSTFELIGGDDWLGPIAVERVDRPALARTRIRVKEPGSADPEFREVDDSPSRLLFLPDSEVELTLEGTQDLSDARLTVNPGSAPPLKRIDPRSFTTTWTLREAVTLEVVLTSSETGLASKPSFLSIGLLRDREPRVTLRAMGVGGRVTPVATIPLTLAATDDFGLAALRIQADRNVIVGDSDKPEAQNKRTAITLPFESDPARPALDHQARHDVVLQSDPPAVGTVLRFTGEADDRCARGVQTGRSGVLAFSVVSPDELFYEILIRQRAERAKFLALLEATEKQTPILEGEPKPEEVVAIARAGQSAGRQFGQIAGRVADALQEMKLNQIGSPKSQRLLQDGVVDPLRALASGPMAQLQASLQTLASAADPKGPTGDEARRRHAEVVTTMKNILEQMSQWESFIDVVNQVAEVIKMEQKVLQETEKAREARAQEVFDDDKP